MESLINQLNDMTMVELKQYARSHSMRGFSTRTNKAALREFIISQSSNEPVVQSNLKINKSLIKAGLKVLRFGDHHNVAWDSLLEVYTPPTSYEKMDERIEESGIISTEDPEYDDKYLAILIMLLIDPKNPYEFDWESMVEMDDELSDWFIHTYMEQLGYERVLKYQKLTKIVMKYKTDIPWDIVSSNATITPEFIGKYADKLDWKVLSGNGAVKEDILSKYSTRLCWDTVAARKRISLEFIRKHLSEFKERELVISRTQIPEILEQEDIPIDCIGVVTE